MINGLIAAIKNSIMPIAVAIFRLSITPVIIQSTPINPKITGMMCEKNINPVAIINHI